MPKVLHHGWDWSAAPLVAGPVARAALADHDSAVVDLRRACKERGLRFTRSRMEILALLHAHGGPLKAYELLDVLHQTSPNAAPAAVYRSLDFLHRHGFIHRLPSIHAYVVWHVDDGERAPTAFICDTCQAATLVDTRPDLSTVSSEATALGFELATGALEVHGTCRQCRDSCG